MSWFHTVMWHFPSKSSGTWFCITPANHHHSLTRQRKKRLQQKGLVTASMAWRKRTEVGKYVPTYQEGIRIKQSLTKELLYHIINRYVALFLKIYICKLDWTQVCTPNGIRRDSETSAKQGRKWSSTLLGGKAGKKPHTSLHSHQRTALPSKIFLP